MPMLATFDLISKDTGKGITNDFDIALTFECAEIFIGVPAIFENCLESAQTRIMQFDAYPATESADFTGAGTV